MRKFRFGIMALIRRNVEVQRKELEDIAAQKT